MPDASTNIPGRALAAPRFNDVNGKPVANLAVAAGRSRKNDHGGFDTLSETFYDVAFWGNHHDLIASLGIGPGDTVTVTGNIIGTDVYEGKAKVKVSGHGIQHFPKRDGQGGYQQAPRAATANAQGEGWGAQNAQQYGSGTGGGGQWPAAAQPGSGQQGFDQPPF